MLSPSLRRQHADLKFPLLRAELASLPKNITVKVTSFKSDGEMMPAGAPCMDMTFGHCPSIQVRLRLRSPMYL
jgi:hypothetical protein